MHTSVLLVLHHKDHESKHNYVMRDNLIKNDIPKVGSEVFDPLLEQCPNTASSQLYTALILILASALAWEESKDCTDQNIFRHM